ncbi:DUF3798 domain-containing protein [Peptostreptococcus anaerobius]|uniref:DUF3798 domain-containing protein n=2 Tax=Peptostreptococcus porci TaxID=2652282 RepID=A0A6N7WYI8_9FIRM|nr:DUF3798 domain-containing protein [Peptostreptococcus porci]MST61858.1 DUF3798 domain-containing protein [Peptostreptococcus porci]
MIKKIAYLFTIVFVLVSLGACTKNDRASSSDKESLEDITNNKSEITIYLPEGQQLDKKYIENKKIAVNFLPKIEGKYTEKQADMIANNIDKHVKVLIISSSNNGLSSVFEKVKDKLPGVITISCDMEEFNNHSLDDLLKNSNIDVGLSVSNTNNLLIGVKNSILMNAKKFAYIYNPNDIDITDLEKAKEYCKENNMIFDEIKVDKKIDDKYFNEIVGKISNIENTAVYSSIEDASMLLLKNFSKYKYIIPSLNSGNDGNIFSQEFALEKEFASLEREEFEVLVSKKLKEEGLIGKLGMIIEDKKSVPIEISIEIAKYMYENNFMIEECYRDVSLVARGNRNLNLSIAPQKIGNSAGYFRYLNLVPRIY